MSPAQQAQAARKEEEAYLVFLLRRSFRLVNERRARVALQAGLVVANDTTDDEGASEYCPECGRRAHADGFVREAHLVSCPDYDAPDASEGRP